MGHGDTKIVVPISAVKTKAHFFGDVVVVEKHNIRNVGEIIIGAVFFGAAGHFLRFDLGPNFESASGSSAPGARRYKKLKNFLAVFVGGGLLSGKINFNPFIGASGFAQNLRRGKIKVGNDDRLIIINTSFGDIFNDKKISKKQKSENKN